MSVAATTHPPTLRFGVALRHAWKLWRDNAVRLAVVSFIVVMPLVAGIEVLREGTGRTSALVLGGELLTGFGVAAVVEALCAGLAEHMLRRHQLGEPPLVSLRAQIRALPLGTLSLLALIVGAAVGIGSVLLFVPGLAAYAWLAVASPIASFERHGAWSALKTSVALVRGRFWPVFALTSLTFIPVALMEQFITVLHQRHLSLLLLIVLEAAAEAVVVSLTAAVVVVVYHALRTDHPSRVMTARPAPRLAGR